MAPKHADLTIPGPRKTPKSWVDNVANKIYIINGECERTGAQYTNELHSGDHGHPYDDFWSWNIDSNKWTREEMVGNTPCPRSETACVYARLISFLLNTHISPYSRILCLIKLLCGAFTIQIVLLITLNKASNSRSRTMPIPSYTVVLLPQMASGTYERIPNIPLPIPSHNRSPIRKNLSLRQQRLHPIS